MSTISGGYCAREGSYSYTTTTCPASRGPLRLIHLAASHDAQALRDELTRVLSSLPEAARLTLTWAQGSEMALHDQTSPASRRGPQ